MKNRGRYRVIEIDLLPDNLFSPSRIGDELNKLTEDGAEIIAAWPLFADTDEPCLLVILKTRRVASTEVTEKGVTI